MAKYGPEKICLKDGREVTIRHCTIEDAPLLNEFQLKLAAETNFMNQYVGQPDKDLLEIQVRWKKAEESKEEIYIGAFVTEKNQEKLVAQLGVHVTRPGHPWIGLHANFGMGVLKGYWGSGVSKALITAMDLHAKKANLFRIEGTVRARNERGVAFYRKNDFRFEGIRKSAAYIDGEYHDEHYISRVYVDLKPSWFPPSLTTGRFILRALKLSDAEAVYSYASKESVARYVAFTQHKTIDDAIHFISDFAFNKYEYDRVPEPMGIAFKENTEKIIGTIGCFWRQKNVRQMELGYVLDDLYWGKGIVAEAGRPLLKYVFENYEIARVQAHCRDENVQSERVMQKLGMKFEGLQKQSVFIKGQYWNTKHYAVLREDFY